MLYTLFAFVKQTFCKMLYTVVYIRRIMHN